MKIKYIYENIIIMLYIIVLAVVTVIIILYSKNIYTKVDKYNSEFEDLEVAMSYINVKVRQNDKMGTISVKNVEELNTDALVIKHNEYDAWIYEYNNMLIESKTLGDLQPTQEEYIKIADIEELKLSLNDKLLTYSITVGDDLEQTLILSLRSDK